MLLLFCPYYCCLIFRYCLRYSPDAAISRYAAARATRLPPFMLLFTIIFDYAFSLAAADV